MKISNLYQNTLIFLFSIVVFILTRQVPFDSYSIIMNLSVILFIILYFISKKNIFKQNETIFYTLGLVILLLVHLVYTGLFTDNKMSYVIRFFLIILIIILSQQIDIKSKSIINVFFTFIFLQSFIIIISEFYLLLFSDLTQANLIRNFVSEKGWGDVYSNGIFYHIQIKGNALIPLGFMLLFNKNIFNSNYFKKLILLLATIFSGNFAFLIAIFIFTITLPFTNNVLSRKKIKNIFWLLLLLILSSKFIYDFAYQKIKLKNEGDSIFERKEQVSYLIDDLFSNPLYSLFGKGLGNTLNIVSSTRDYRESIFYEIQPIYFLNQMGLLFFIIFLSFHFYIAYYKYRNKLLLLIYVCFFLYSSTNPYIFDTNQFVVIILLNTYQCFSIQKSNLSTQPKKFN